MHNSDTANALETGLWESAAAIATAVDLNSMPEALYWEHACRHRLRHHRSDSWDTDTKAIDIEGGVELLRVDSGPYPAALLALDGVLIHARVFRGRVTVNLASADRDRGEAALIAVREALPAPAVEPGAPRANFSFSWRTERGVQWTSRMLDVAPWNEIKDNYASSTRHEVDRLMGEFRPGHAGQTIIWHGESGTGKTHALRALAFEWREWCNVHIVTDPDQLFGSDAAYLMEVVAAPPGPRNLGHHRLIVLEDSGELLTGDARRLVGHGLSRFLNVCDGLLGQAERVSLLVTTNEPMKRLHPAVRRPGRCAAEVEFRHFEPEEAATWLDSRGGRAASPSPLTIAELYALVDGKATPVAARAGGRHPAVGFAQSL